MTSESLWTPTVYRELRRMADGMMAGEREGHTLEPTALTHEVWLRLLASRNAGELSHDAFLGLAAQAMRRILTEYARKRGAQKRGGNALQVPLEGELAARAPEDFALDMDAALSALEQVDVELARLVELRFFGGLSVEELAQLLETSERTVKRRWRFARAWLQEHMREQES